MNNDMPFDHNGGRGFLGPMGFDHHGGTGALGWTIFALQLLLLFGIAALLVRAFLPAGPGFAPRPRTLVRRRGRAHDPLDVVRMRYARGEITREQYVQAAQDLGGTPAEAPTDEIPPN